MIAKLKIWLAAAGAFAVAVMYALQQKAKAQSAEQRADMAEAAREYENAGSEAMVTGLHNEHKVRNEKADPDKRDHFS